MKSPEQMQQDAENHLNLCFEWCEYNEYSDGLVLDTKSHAPDPYRPTEPDPSIAHFCGCVTCIVRETLYAALVAE